MKYLVFSTTEQAFGAGVIAGDYLCRVFNSGGSSVFAGNSMQPQFPWNTQLPLGTYTVKCQRFDSDGKPIGPEFNGSVEWTDSVMIGVPSGVAIVDL